MFIYVIFIPYCRCLPDKSEEIIFGNPMTPAQAGDYFNERKSNDCDNSEKSKATDYLMSKCSERESETNFMYIQMEFCEKSTLR